MRADILFEEKVLDTAAERVVVLVLEVALDVCLEAAGAVVMIAVRVQGVSDADFGVADDAANAVRRNEYIWKWKRQDAPFVAVDAWASLGQTLAQIVEAPNRIEWLFLAQLTRLDGWQNFLLGTRRRRRA